MEAVKTYKSNPYFMLGTTQIPTWITPFVMVLFVSFLIPNTSFLGHVCGLAFGYGCKLRRPTLKCRTDCNRGTWISQIPRTTRLGFTMDWRKIKSARKTTSLCLCRSEDLRTIRCSANHEPNISSIRRQQHCVELYWKHAKIRALKGERKRHVYLTCTKSWHNSALRDFL